MCRDRLPELRAKAGLPVEISVQYDAETNTVDVGVADAPKTELVHVDFGELFKLLDHLGPLYDDVKHLHEEINTLRSGVHQHNNKDKFEDKVQELKKQLHGIKSGIERFKESHKDTTDPLLVHIRSSHILSLSTWSSEELDQLSALLVAAHERHRAYVRKEFQITAGYDKDISEEELQSLLDNKAPTMFTQDLLTETKLAKLTLTEIRERHDQVVKLEKSIVELNTLFQDLALLVRTQGKTIDDIESHMYEASVRTTEAAGQMQQAYVKARSAMKKKYICLLVITSIVIIFIVLLAYSLS